jgi:hypothetical protein
VNYSLTFVSRNEKTGPIPVSTTSQFSCPSDCPLNSGRGCYAETGPLKLFWDKVTNATDGYSFAAFLIAVDGLPHGQLWRHNQAGDLPGEGNEIDAVALAQLVKANKGKRGFTYTHKPVIGNAANSAAIKSANDNGFTINLSGDNLSDADTLAALDIGPVVTVLPLEYGRTYKGGVWTETLAEYKARTKHLPKQTPGGRKIVVCPATFLDTDCAHCQLCAKRDRKGIVGFPAHGTSKKKADRMARA